jgi:hypothetical protein
MYGSSVFSQAAGAAAQSGRGLIELAVSLAAATTMALMVVAGGSALSWAPTETAMLAPARPTEAQESLTICREDHVGYRCIAEAS